MTQKIKLDSAILEAAQQLESFQVGIEYQTMKLGKMKHDFWKAMRKKYPNKNWTTAYLDHGEGVVVFPFEKEGKK